MPRNLGRDSALFERKVIAATGLVEAVYFDLPYNDGDGVATAHRERVYCYELYHQLRDAWDEAVDGATWSAEDYLLNGELCKQRVPLFRRHGLERSPDLLVHVPTTNASNLVVLEVKSTSGILNGKRKHVRKDLDTLARFIESAQYVRGLYLVYGADDVTRRLSSIVRAWVAEDEAVRREQLSKIRLLRHAGPLAEAVASPILDVLA